MEELKSGRRSGKIAYFHGAKLIIKPKFAINRQENNQKQDSIPQSESKTPPKKVSSLINIFTPDGSHDNATPASSSSTNDSPSTPSKSSKENVKITVPETLNVSKSTRRTKAK